MPPTVYVIRHAQGEHNVNDSHHLRDALLTETGKSQCKELQEKFPFLQDVEVILASPLRRTVQTVAYTFAPELEKRQIPIVLVPKAQEISSLACDVGHDAEVTITEAPKLIAEAVPSWDASNLDTTLVDDSWNSKRGIYASNLSAVHQRAAEMRNWIYNRPEKHIALVTHGGFLHYFTEDWTGYVQGKGTGYLNCEYRKLEFTEDSDKTESHLRECGSMLGKQARPAGLDDHLFHEIEKVEKAS
ncbi:phosphoglycerate mutase family protein-like protein [Penicillium cataractarum]|uniref:Phosphoglycerate mutase family protein-like protein n=1 Tax=Penicillium cataractarum TaxID=2100454 RepID=A0A9W9V0K0_9EURO|nr:phosphoglycerate mutase family protein-like protein [Penicillium cataractarum]KAJ5364403.1 phosphoglycerate mutase family protein-like protein [Penicillium cataractarum]